MRLTPPTKKTLALSVTIEVFSFGFFVAGALPGYIGFGLAIGGFLVLLTGNLMTGV